jgi:hypothetical protein
VPTREDHTLYTSYDHSVPLHRRLAPPLCVCYIQEGLVSFIVKLPEMISAPIDTAVALGSVAFTVALLYAV